MGVELDGVVSQAADVTVKEALAIVNGCLSRKSTMTEIDIMVRLHKAIVPPGHRCEFDDTVENVPAPTCQSCAARLVGLLTGQSVSGVPIGCGGLKR